MIILLLNKATEQRMNIKITEKRFVDYVLAHFIPRSASELGDI